MRLFNLLNSLSPQDNLNWLILQRLSIVESIAIFKFGKLPIEDRVQENNILQQINLKCIQQQVPKLQKKCILTIIHLNMHLAKLIQTDCFQEWANSDIIPLRQSTLMFINDTLSKQVTETNALKYLRSYLNNITYELLLYLINPPKNISLNYTTQVLRSIFPHLNKLEVDSLINTMSTYLSLINFVRDI